MGGFEGCGSVLLSLTQSQIGGFKGRRWVSSMDVPCGLVSLSSTQSQLLSLLSLLCFVEVFRVNPSCFSSLSQGHISWGVNGLPNLSLGPAMLDQPTPGERPPLKLPYGRITGGCPKDSCRRGVFLPPWIPHAIWSRSVTTVHYAPGRGSRCKVGGGRLPAGWLRTVYQLPLILNYYT
jgi:hypothetical protein